MAEQAAETAEIVALAGDWHGNLTAAREAVRSLAGFGVKRIYHLGDFGIWPGPAGAHYLDHVNAVAKHFGMEIWVTPGNHEDYDQIEACRDYDEVGIPWIRPRTALLPRGHRWTHGDRTFVSLGGAPSIDFEHRTEGVSWWRAEMITLDEAEMVAGGGHAEVMLAHDAPDGGTELVQRIIDTPPDRNPWSVAGLTYAAEGRELMNIAFAGVEPLLFAHGHYHVFDDTFDRPGTRFLALSPEGAQGSLALLRLRDLAVSWDGQNWFTHVVDSSAAGAA